MTRSLPLLISLGALAFAACDDDGSASDAAVAQDAAPIDAEIIDSRIADAAPPQDAAPADAAPIDARVDEDAAVADAAVDAAPPTDVEVIDADPVDAQIDEDAEPADAAPAPDASYERDPALVPLGGPCPAEVRLGGFKVESNDAEGYTAIDGVVRDTVVAGQVPEVAAAQDGCQLLRRRRLVCEPTCDPGMTCDLGGVCVPMPRGQDMGLVDFHGLAQPLTLEALQPGNTYFFTRLPHPGFEPQTVIHVANAEGFIAPIELYGIGVAPLVPHEETWVLTEGEPLQLHWDPPPEGARSTLFFELNIDQHGLSPANLVCDLPDTGEAAVPAAMIDALIEAGVTGFPTGRVARRTVDSTTDEGRCVDLVVSSVRPIAIEVTDHLPCTSHEDCPSGQCDLVIQQCL